MNTGHSGLCGLRCHHMVFAVYIAAICNAAMSLYIVFAVNAKLFIEFRHDPNASSPNAQRAGARRACRRATASPRAPLRPGPVSGFAKRGTDGAVWSWGTFLRIYSEARDRGEHQLSRFLTVFRPEMAPRTKIDMCIECNAMSQWDC